MNAVPPKENETAIRIPGRTRTGHGGNYHQVCRELGIEPDDLLDFSANINPLGPPEWFRSLVSRKLETVVHYPDAEYPELREKIAAHHQVSPVSVIPANGSTDLLYLLPKILDCKRAVIPVPSYIDYHKAAALAGLERVGYGLPEADDFQLDIANFSTQLRAGDLVILASPNNPTGSTIDSEALINLAGDHAETIFIVDEAFLDFVDGAHSVAGSRDNIITLNSMTKFYGVPGLRLGFGVFPEKFASKVEEQLPPWSLNSLAYAFGTRCLDDTSYHLRSRAETLKLRLSLISQLSTIEPLKIYPSQANYLLLRLAGPLSGAEVANQLLQHGILIRCCDNYEGLDDSFIRVAVRTEKENSRLVEALAAVLAPTEQRFRKRRNSPAPAIMFQGTSSNAGKSVLTAALCRILLQDGVRVAPFKAQNMSLNSFVTARGEEMGRAQVVQAQAARLDPDVRMNPILLKPNSDTGSQIIVNGYPVGNMSVMDYSRYKPEAWDAAKASYDSLASEFEAIVLEGAGSPGEVNLKNEDIVNMKMAAYAEAPVLLVGDIDRGGVYASFVGTLEVLSSWERNLVAGYVVNRFRGQQSLLESAHDFLFAHTGKKTLGVIPYLSDLGLPEEDSVSFKAGLYNTIASNRESVDICLLNFPHISNFTDVEPFLAEPDVSLRVVNKVQELGNPDAIILPGSKNVIGDLHFLLESGFIEPLKKRANSGCEIVGVCGGYQVLGRSIHDPHHIESSAECVDALGLLHVVTEMKKNKTLTRKRGVHLESGQPVMGYEIHHGISDSAAHPPVIRFDDGTVCGSLTDGGRIWGSYLHGIFDSDQFRRWFIDRLRERRGYPKVGKILASYDLEPAFDRLADTVRQSLDMDQIYSLLNL